MRPLATALVHRLALAVSLVLVVLAGYAAVRAMYRAAGARDPGVPAWQLGAALIAVALPPVRRRLDRIAGRIAYGPAGGPYAVMNRFVRRIADTLAVDDVLPDLARTALQAVHGSGSEVRLWLADGGEWRQTWPPGRDRVDGEAVVLHHGGDQVGRLRVESAEGRLSPSDRALLDRLAGPAGLALSNVRLTYELRRRLAEETELAEQLDRSRARLLEARAAQRRRFARAVEERVLTHLTVAERALAAADAGREGRVAAVDSAVADTLAALDALRDLAVGVFPPVLHDSGVHAALDWYGTVNADRFVLRATGLDGPRPDPVIEATAYFCGVALLDDMAGGRPVTINLDLDRDTVRLAVAGSRPPSADTGQLVRDRVDAFGGTALTVSTPDCWRTTVTLPVSGDGA